MWKSGLVAKDNFILKTGYSTGSHATSALKAALLAYFTNNLSIKDIDITLPDEIIATLKIDLINKTNDYIQVIVTKSDNDDIDVTKGCEITCWFGTDLSKVPYKPQRLDHNPYIFTINNTNLYIYAGEGLGVVTKKGLKPPVGYPAINPVPLDMMKSIFEEMILNSNSNIKKLYAVFEVKNGEKIAQDTVNPKLGIVGGISFLGKKGIVKPISSDSYLESLAEEVKIAAQNEAKTIIFTMGNSSLKFAHKYYNVDEECFIEIGNFVFEALKLIRQYNFTKLIIVANIGKLTKIAQGQKNTNNRYGSIDFEMLKTYLDDNFPDVETSFVESANSVAEIEEFIQVQYSDLLDKFYEILLNKALNNVNVWIKELNIQNLNVEIAITDGENLKAKSDKISA